MQRSQVQEVATMVNVKLVNTMIILARANIAHKGNIKTKEEMPARAKNAYEVFIQQEQQEQERRVIVVVRVSMDLLKKQHVLQIV